jgi:transposase InsO family protein
MDIPWTGEQLKGLPVKFLVRDRDTKFTLSFDEVSRAEGIRITRTPVRAPQENAFAERFVGTVRRECLDRMLTLGRRHLERTLTEYVVHYTAIDPTGVWVSWHYAMSNRRHRSIVPSH